MAERWFLKIDGIAGDSADAAHKGEIEIESWSWGVANTASPSTGGGSGVGKPLFQDFQFVSAVSVSTPALFLTCATGIHVKEATLSGVRSGGSGKGPEFARFELRDVRVASLELADDPEDAPSQQFSLEFARVQVTFIPQKASGGSGSPVTTGWDLAANTKV